MKRGRLVPRPDPQTRQRRLAAALFFATCASVFGVYLLRWQESSILEEPLSVVRAGVFTATLMGILLTHELGHFVVARRSGFRTSLPIFLPFPFLVGTLGAIIRLEENPRTRLDLLMMGAGGPLAGFVVISLVVILWMLSGPVEATSQLELSRPLIFWIAAIPSGTVPEISPGDPLAFAAWIGCLVTSMNLLPFGQLDGGHVLSAIAPGKARQVGWGVTALLALGGLIWIGWPLWMLVLHLLGARHPVEIRPRRGRGAEVGIDRRGYVVAFACAITFLFTWSPVPIRWTG